MVECIFKHFSNQVRKKMNVFLHLHLVRIFTNKLYQHQDHNHEKQFRNVWCDLLRPAAYGALQSIHSILSSSSSSLTQQRILFASAILNIDVSSVLFIQYLEVFRTVQDMLRYISIDAYRRVNKLEEPLPEYLFDSSVLIPEILQRSKIILCSMPSSPSLFQSWHHADLDSHTAMVLLRNSGLSDHDQNTIKHLLHNLYHTNLDHPTRNADELFCMLTNEHRMKPVLLMGVGLEPLYIPQRLSETIARQLASELDNLVQFVYSPDTTWTMIVFLSILTSLSFPPAITARRFSPYQFPSMVLFYNLDGTRSFYSPFHVVANNIGTASHMSRFISGMLLCNNPEVDEILREDETKQTKCTNETNDTEEEEEEDEDDDCFVCCSPDITHTSHPCRHLSYCTSCSRKSLERLCFVCMQPIHKIVRIYYSETRTAA